MAISREEQLKILGQMKDSEINYSDKKEFAEIFRKFNKQWQFEGLWFSRPRGDN